MMYPSKSALSRLLALVLALCLCAGTMLCCSPDVPFDTEQPDDTPDTPTEPDPEPEQPPASTLPDDINVVFYTDTEDEAPYIYDVNGNHFDTSHNRYFDRIFN